MLTLTWLSLAIQTLNRLESTNTCRVAVLGIGNELSGDDGVGLGIAGELAKLHDTIELRGSEATRLIISAGLAPENFTGQLRHFRPNMVILIDAAQMDAAPGSVVWLSGEQTVGMSASTHSLPLSILTQYLIAEIGCEVYLIGIQAGSNVYGDELSMPVAEAVREVVKGLETMLFPRV